MLDFILICLALKRLKAKVANCIYLMSNTNTMTTQPNEKRVCISDVLAVSSNTHFGVLLYFIKVQPVHCVFHALLEIKTSSKR